MRYSAIASLALVGTVAAQNSTTTATGCVASYDTCRTTRTDGLSANQALCASDNASCQGACYAAYNTCRTARVDGISANQAECVSEYATCLGENPLSPSGGLASSFVPYSATASSSMTSSAAGPVSTAACQLSYNQCRGAPDANFAYCASQFAGCLGTNPFAANGTNTVTAAPSGGMVYTTEVVTALTTVCPAPTAGTYTTTLGPNVYTISSATTITVTNCPCTVSKPMTAATNGTMTPSANRNNGTASTTMPAIYTGAAAQFGAGFGFLGAAAGAVMLL